MSRRGPYRNKINPTGKQPAANAVENRMIEAIDDLAEFDKYRAEVLPAIRKQLEAGASTKAILGTAKAVAVARLALIAVTEGDSKLALSAIRELLERTEGRVVDKKEITHSMAELKDDDLDALLITAVSDADDDE